jgi:predicted nucleotidyltransferase
VQLSAFPIPEPRLRDFAARAAERLAADPRLLGLLAGGSAIAGKLDRHSDLDLVVVVRDEGYEAVLAERRDVAAGLAPLLYAFTGEHVGEPRLLICLYGDPLLHVDLKFVMAGDLDRRVETPIVLWERAGAVSARLAGGSARWPNHPPEWFEERFWIWVHYGAAKLGRGELLEVVDMLAFLRQQVLGPLAARRAGVEQRGVRRLEEVAPAEAAALLATLGGRSRARCAAALRAAVQLYRDYREDAPPAAPNPAGEAAVIAYLDAVIAEGLRR